MSKKQEQVQIVDDVCRAFRASGLTVWKWAEDSGASERQIYRLLAGDARMVRATTLSGLVAALGMRLALVPSSKRAIRG